MSDTVVIGIDSNLIPSDKKNRLKYASKYYNGSFRNSSKKNKPGINAGNLTFSEAFNIILQSGGKRRLSIRMFLIINLTRKKQMSIC